MEENKNPSSSESENANLQSKYKEIWVLISSINDNTFIHTSIRKFCFKKKMNAILIQMIHVLIQI